MNQKLIKKTIIASLYLVIVSPFTSIIYTHKSNINKSSVNIKNIAHIHLVLTADKSLNQTNINSTKLSMNNIKIFFSQIKSNNLRILSIVLSAIVFSFFAFEGIKNFRESATKFEDISIDNQIEKLNTVKDRTNINLNSFSKNDLASLVGVILVVDEDKTEQDFNLKNTGSTELNV
ncbi:MAG: hypothetical protein AB4372_35120 [Xenococcus sp. (in: cyanobacteria)]